MYIKDPLYLCYLKSKKPQISTRCTLDREFIGISILHLSYLFYQNLTFYGF